jgi:hypothetical protein
MHPNRINAAFEVREIMGIQQRCDTAIAGV